MLFPISGRLSAEDILGIGIHLGGHYNVGNINSQQPDILVESQTNLLLGLSLKTNFYFLFVRTGVDGTFLLNKGRVLEGSDQIQNYKIQYMSVPGFIGLRFPLKDSGECYIGGGIAYLWSYGSVKVRGYPSYDLNSSALGYGFLCGISLSFPVYVQLYLEWQYIDARTAAVIKTQSGYDWKNFYIDFTGHRFFVGVIYYAI